MFGNHPRNIGRYRVAGRLGEGGMGVVYRAQDPELGRPVAIKVLRTFAVGSDPADTARMMREARVLAAVPHPNIVEVFEVGSLSGMVYIAMEFVEGRTLSDWRFEEQPTWREVVTAFVQAGRGLAAAHDSGVVHRDFKPANALMAVDGRVRVLDFGLAKPVDEAVSSFESGGGSGPVAASGSRSSRLTETGTLMGTPAYMAPEQLRRKPAGPSADQFAFCVALWEALFDERPFRGSTPKAVHLAIRRRDIRDPSRRGVPRKLVAVLMRGLAYRSEDRWPHMSVLLDRLEAACGGKRWRAIATVGAALTVGAIAAAVGATTPTNAVGPCALELDGQPIWSEQTRERFGAAFTEAGAAAQWAAASNAVDGYHTELETAYVAGCEAQRAGGTNDGELSCLRTRAQGLGLLLEAVESQSLHRQLAKAVLGLPKVAACSGVTDSGPPPAIADAVSSERTNLARVVALRSAGQYDEAFELTAAAAERADALGYPPLLIEALQERGATAISLGKHDAARIALERGYALAVKNGDDAHARSLAEGLAHLTGAELFLLDEALAWSRHANAAAERLGDADPERNTRRILGNAYFAAGRPKEAREYFLAAVTDLRERQEGSDKERIGVLRQLGNVSLHLSRTQAAVDYFERARSIAEQLYGPESHDVAALTFNVGLAIEADSHDAQAAHARFARAAELYAAIWNEDHPDLADATYHAGMTQARGGDVDNGLVQAGKGAEMLRRLLGQEHPYVVHARLRLAELQLDSGSVESGRALIEVLVTEAEGRLEDTHPLLAALHRAKSRAFAAVGDYESAQASLDKGIVVARAFAETEPEELWEAQLEQAELWATVGRSADAIAAAEGVLAEVERKRGSEDRAWAEVRLRTTAILVSADASAQALTTLDEAQRAMGIMGVAADQIAFAELQLALARVEVVRDASAAKARAQRALVGLRAAKARPELQTEIERFLVEAAVAP